MNVLLKFVGLIAAPLVIAPMLLAQWPSYAKRGVPRTANGQPDLTAAAPRTADGKPDLSGIWDNGRNTNVQRGAGRARGADINAAPAGPAAPAAAGTHPSPPAAPLSYGGGGC